MGRLREERTYNVTVSTREHFVAEVRARSARGAAAKARRGEWDDIDAVGNRTPTAVVEVRWVR